MTEHEQITNVPKTTALLPSCFSFKQKIGTYRKTKLDDNCWMKLYMSGTPGGAVLSFVDSDDKNINVPDSFVLRDIKLDENYPIYINPISQQLFVLVLERNYSFTHNEKTGKFILQWAMMGDFEWE